MRVEVKARHIENGVRWSPQSCPIALAIKEQSKIPHATYVLVGPHEAAVYVGNYQTGQYKLSKHAQRFIQEFDDGWVVAPATFYLEEIK